MLEKSAAFHIPPVKSILYPGVCVPPFANHCSNMKELLDSFKPGSNCHIFHPADLHLQEICFILCNALNYVVLLFRSLKCTELSDLFNEASFDL